MWDLGVDNASVGEAHTKLLESTVPESIRQYIRSAIADLVGQHGNHVRVTIGAQGKDRDTGTGARIEVHGEPAPKADEDDSPHEAPTTVEQAIDADYRPNRSKKLVHALKRIASRAG